MPNWMSPRALASSARRAAYGLLDWRSHAGQLARQMAATGALVALLLTSGGAASAQADADQGRRAARAAAKIFEETCYGLLPNLDAIAQLAQKRQWQPITGAALRALMPQERPEMILAWNATVDGTTFPLSVTPARVDPDLVRDMPRFAGGTSFHCSILLHAKSPPQHAAELIVKLMGRPADATADAGRMRYSTWAGQNEKMLVFVQHGQVLAGGRPMAGGGLLSVSINRIKE